MLSHPPKALSWEVRNQVFNLWLLLHLRLCRRGTQPAHHGVSSQAAQDTVPLFPLNSPIVSPLTPRKDYP